VTTLTDNFNAAVGVQLGGWVTQVQISWPSFTASDNTNVQAGTQIVAVDSTGSFSQAFTANDNAIGLIPGQIYYTFTFTVMRVPSTSSHFPTLPSSSLYSAQVIIPFSGTPVNWAGCTVIENWPNIGGGGQSLQPSGSGVVFALPKLSVYASYPAAGANGTLPGPAFDLPATNPPSPNSYGTTIPFGALDFASGMNQSAFLHLTLPPDWINQPVSLTLMWMSSASTGSTTWQAAAFGAITANTVLTGDVSFNTPVSQATSNNVTPGTPSITTLNGIPVIGSMPNSEIWFRITRTDSQSGTSSLLSVAVALARAL
jgi:hypothetical protein